MEQIIEQLKQEIKQQHAKETRSLTLSLQVKDTTIDTLKSTLEENQNTILALQMAIFKQNEKAEQEKKLLEQKITEVERNASLIKEQLELKEKELKEKEAKEKEGIIVIAEDPRVRNRPLPNDAVLTYNYGARAYISDIYSGFVWRNGFWYRIKPELRFKPHSNRRLRKWSVSSFSNFDVLNKQINIDQVETDININDAFIPVFLHDIRYFVKFIYSFGHNIVYTESAYFYIPHMQGAVKIKVNNILLQSLVYEDPASFREKPNNAREMSDWNNYC